MPELQGSAMMEDSDRLMFRGEPFVVTAITTETITLAVAPRERWVSASRVNGFLGRFCSWRYGRKNGRRAFFKV